MNSAAGGSEPSGLVHILHSSSEVRTLVADSARGEGLAYASCCDIDACLQQLDGSRPNCVVTDSVAAGSATERDLISEMEIAGVAVAVIVISSPRLGSYEARRRGVSAALAEPPVRGDLIMALRTAMAESTQKLADRQLVESFRTCVNRLSQDERKVMRAICEGMLNKQIAREFGVSIRTVEQRRRRVFAKMDVASAIPLAGKVATVRAIERLRPGLAGNQN